MADKAPSTARLEAFSDGVIAVIITIMVLELKVPHEKGIAGLHAIYPILLIYLLSFAFVAIYWINHQHLIERVENADPAILYANLFFLFCLSLLPFFTSYLIEKNIETLPVVLYAGCMIVTGFSFLLLRIAVHRHLKNTGRLAAADMAEGSKHLISLLLYLVAMGLAYLHPPTALILVAVVTLIWILPRLAVRRR